MDTEEIIKLNQTRWKTQLSDLIKSIRPEILKQFKSVHICDEDNHEVQLSDIDFTQPLLFVSPVDFTELISVYGLLKINKVPSKDTNISGNNSRIRTTYMVVDSTSIKYSNINNTDEDLTYNDLPDQWKPLSYMNKQLCIWKLLKESHKTKTEYMYDMCAERIYDRYITNHNDWLFFMGTKYEFDTLYKVPITFKTYTIKLTNNETHINKTDTEREDIF